MGAELVRKLPRFDGRLLRPPVQYVCLEHEHCAVATMGRTGHLSHYPFPFFVYINATFKQDSFFFITSHVNRHFDATGTTIEHRDKVSRQVSVTLKCLVKTGLVLLNVLHL